MRGLYMNASINKKITFKDLIIEYLIKETKKQEGDKN